MGLRVGAMQAPRQCRRANAREPLWHIQARHHGGHLGRTIYRKPFPSLPRVERAAHVSERPLGTPPPLIIVHGIHGIRGTALRRASADAEQEPGRAAPADVALT
jgi:hypothetical protein